MSTLDEIKAATARLKPDEQAEFFSWWIETDTFKQRQLSALKHEIERGLNDLDNGRYQNYDESSALQLAEEIGKSGRERLKTARKSRKA